MIEKNPENFSETEKKSVNSAINDYKEEIQELWKMAKINKGSLSNFTFKSSNLDAESFAGCLVSPDDLYSSAFDRYRTVTIKFFWWSKSWRYKIYSAKSNVVRESSR